MACAVLADVLHGGGQGGTYQYDQKLKLSSKATDGMVGAPWLAEEKLDENTTLPCLDSFRRRKPEVEHAHAFLQAYTLTSAVKGEELFGSSSLHTAMDATAWTRR